MDQQTQTIPYLKHNPNSSVDKRMLKTSYWVDMETSFRILIRNHNLRDLPFLMHLSNEIHSLELYIQKLVMQSIHLSWSQVW